MCGSKEGRKRRSERKRRIKKRKIQGRLGSHMQRKEGKS